MNGETAPGHQGTGQRGRRGDAVAEQTTTDETYADETNADETLVGEAPLASRTPARTPVVGAALLDSASRPTRLLAAQRAYPAALRGLWEFPGGKQEPGESPETALVRECREELDLPVRVVEEVAAPAPEGWSLGERFVMRVFTVVAEPGLDPEALAETVRAGDDHLDVRWLPLAEPAEVLGLPWIPADLPIVAALLEMLRTE